MKHRFHKCQKCSRKRTRWVRSQGDLVARRVGVSRCWSSVTDPKRRQKQKERQRRSEIPSTAPTHAQSCRSLELLVLPYPLLCLFYFLLCAHSHHLIMVRCGIGLPRCITCQPDSQPIRHPANQQATQAANQPRNQPASQTAKQASSQPNS